MEIEVLSDANLSKVLNTIRVKSHTASYNFCVSGDALRLANRHKESLPHYLQAIMKDRTNRDAHCGLALSYKAMGNYEKALVYFTKANELLIAVDTTMEIGMCNYALENFEAAAKYFQAAIKIDPNDFEAKSWLAMVHEELHEYEMAFFIYNHLIEKDPTNLNAYINKGTLEMSMEKYQEATKTFSQIIKINPDFYKAYFGIGLCFDKLGMYREAKRYYSKFLTLKPNSDTADFVYARLKKLSTMPIQQKRLGTIEHLSLVR